VNPDDRGQTTDDRKTRYQRTAERLNRGTGETETGRVKTEAGNSRESERTVQKMNI